MAAESPAAPLAPADPVTPAVPVSTSPTPKLVSSSPRRLIPFGILLLAALIPAVGSFGGPFWYLDDRPMIIDSPIMRGEESLASAFYTPTFSHYAPLHEALIYVQWKIFGNNPLPFRIVSVLLHFLAAIACWRMLRRIAPETVALGAAALFALHPAQCECVDWIVEQKTLWCGLFSFAAFAVYMDTQRSTPARITLSLALLILACLGKSSGLVMAILIVLYEILLSHDAKPLWTRLALTTPFIVLAAVFSKLALWAGSRLESVAVWSLHDFLLNLPATLLCYLRITFLPWGPSFFHDFAPVKSFGQFEFYGYGAGLILLAGAGIAVARPERRKLFIFSVLAWCAVLSPMLNISIWTFPAYDRYQYFALPFIIVAVWVLLDGIIARLSVPSPVASKTDAAHKIAWGVAGITFGIFGFARGQLYSDELRVMQDAVIKAPNNANAHGLYAGALTDKWLQAANQKRGKEMLAYAKQIDVSTEKAIGCWNFFENFAAPGSLLLNTAHLMNDSGAPDRAEKYLRVVLSAPRLSSHTAEQNSARALMAEIRVNRANKIMGDAERAANDPVKVAAFSNAALFDLADARQYGTPSDAALWLECAAHHRLAVIAEKSGDVAIAKKHRDAILAAVNTMTPTSTYYRSAVSNFGVKINVEP
jgi:hypothetical protein